MSAKPQENIAGPSNQAAFAFVQDLALESSRGRIEIPSFPEVAVRIRKVLSDDNCDTSQVAKVVSAEPAMAAKLLQMANSAALNPGGNKITELKSAIARIGFANVRTASLAYAMETIKNAPALAPVKKPLNELWEHSVKVAAMAFVVARSWTSVNADQALLAGLMHGMGRVYILTRAVKHPDLFNDAEAYQRIVQDWHAAIAKAVLESWDIASDIVDAVEQFEQLERLGGEEPDLTDVLTIANLLVSFHKDPAAMEVHLSQTTATARLGITRDACVKVLLETQNELASLHKALGG
jgi:HD-like signal output (HDOD) protein